MTCNSVWNAHVYLYLTIALNYTLSIVCTLDVTKFEGMFSGLADVTC
jgi:hypothetical protein